MIDGISGTFLLPLAKELGSDILLKATIVLIISGMLALAFRRSSAAARYAIWNAAFVIMILLPVFSAILPSWDFEQLRRFWAGPESSRAVVLSDAHTASQAFPQSGSGMSTGQVIFMNEPEAQSSAIFSQADTIVSVLFIIWLCGTVILLLRLAFHVSRVNRITLRTLNGDNEKIWSIAAPLIESLRIRRPVSVITSDEVSIPFAWGVFHPVVIFPASAREWPLDRIRSVLLHELAHVARWDYLFHLIVEITRALYWPNPMVWLSASRSATERERACDDFALRFGTSSGTYASHLLHIARLQVEQCVPVGAVTMAGEPGLVGRIRYVMNKKLDRSPLRSSKLLLTAIMALLVILPLGTFEAFGVKWRIPKTGELIDELRSNPDPLLRRRAAWWLGEHEQLRSVKFLIDALNDESAEVRLVSAWALGEIKDEDSIEPLIETLEEDDDPLVREMAALALGEIENPSAVDPLVEAFEQDEDMRLAVLWALGEIENRGSRKAGRAREDAFDKIDHRSWNNDEVWTGELGDDFPDTRNVRTILTQLWSNQAETRRDAALNLGYLGILHHYESTRETEQVVDALLATLRDPVPEVRAAAVWSLDEINPSRSARIRKIYQTWKRKR